MSKPSHTPTSYEAAVASEDTIGSHDLAQAAVDWMYANKPQEMSNAIHRQITKRQTAGYREMAREFVESLDKLAPEFLLAASRPEGVRVHQDDRGRIVVTKDGKSYGWASAIRNKVIALS